MHCAAPAPAGLVCARPPCTLGLPAPAGTLARWRRRQTLDDDDDDDDGGGDGGATTTTMTPQKVFGDGVYLGNDAYAFEGYGDMLVICLVVVGRFERVCVHAVRVVRKRTRDRRTGRGGESE
jgi:hypothetical protein